MASSSLAQQVEAYLDLRRALGFQPDWPGVPLRDFARFADGLGHQGPLTNDLAVQWALASGNPGQAARRLAALRGFARHRAAYDPGTEVPPPGLVGGWPRRSQPHIYSDAEITALLDAAGRLPPRQGLRPRTYVAFLSLLLSTGLRLSEACRLRRDDVDLGDGVLTIRKSKFRKSRLVPLHPTTTQALARYAAERDLFAAASDGFFRTETAPALTSMAVESTFSRLRERLGWTAAGRTRRPRIHDLRHTFAVRRLLQWYIDGVDVDRAILALAAYLGHAKVSYTYWYLSAVPELMAITSQRFERFAGEEREGVE